MDLRSALDSISEVLGINYVLGGNVQPGQPITIVTSEGIAIEKVPDLLDSVLRTYNLALVRTGDVFTVMQAQEAVPGQPPTGPPPKTEVYVYYLRNANAVDLANVLTQLFQGGAPPGGYQRSAERSEALSSTLERQQLTPQPPTPQPTRPEEPEPPPQVIVRPQQPGAQQAIAGELVGQTTIVPDEKTNSLIIRTAPENYPSIEETIRKLDIRPLQVLIEVTIAEITLDKSTQFGIDFLIRSHSVFGREQTNAEFERQDLAPAEGGLRMRVFDSQDVDATLRALAADARVNVLSTPRILSVNNQEARILVGSEVPFVQFQRATIGEAVDRVVQFRNVGLELKVTPRINPDRYISLDLLQQVSSLTADVLFDAPIITTREAETSLVVGDRQTVVLGGLIEDRKEKRRSGIPLLKDIPILGIFFGSSSTRVVKTELVITLTPYIVGTDLELQNLRGQLESGTEFYEKELRERRKKGLPVPGQLGPGGVRDTTTPLEAPPPTQIQETPPVQAPDTTSVPPVPPAPDTSAIRQETPPPPAPAPADTSTVRPAPPSPDAPDSLGSAKFPVEPAPPPAGATPVAPSSETPGPGALGALMAGALVGTSAVQAGGARQALPSGNAGKNEDDSPRLAGKAPDPEENSCPPQWTKEFCFGTTEAAVPLHQAKGDPVVSEEASPGALEAQPVGTPAPASAPEQTVTYAAAGASEPAGAPEPAGLAASFAYRVQVMADPDHTVASKGAGRIQRMLAGRFPVYIEQIDSVYKIRVGNFATRREANRALVEIRKMGLSDAFTVPVGAPLGNASHSAIRQDGGNPPTR